MEPTRPQTLLLPLLLEHTVKAFREIVRKNHARETNIGIARRQKSRQIALRLDQGNRPRPATANRLALPFCSVDKFA